MLLAPTNFPEIRSTKKLPPQHEKKINKKMKKKSTK